MPQLDKMLFKLLDGLSPISEVKIQDNCAWKIFTKGIKKEDAIEYSEIIGEKKLGEKIFDMLSVMA